MNDKSEVTLNRRRGTCKKQINKFVKLVEELETLSQISAEQVTALQDRMSRIETTFSNFEEIQNEIEEISKEEDVEKQYEIRDQIEDIFYKNIGKAKHILSATNGSNEPLPDTTGTHSNASNSDHTNAPQQCVNLPKIDLPKFSGCYFNWLDFRDTFDSLINQNNRISNIDKFHYLKSSLSGEAAQVIKAIELASSNYISAWELLLNRYNNTRLLLLNHTRALFNLEQINKESAHKLRKLNDDIAKHLNALKSLGQPTDAWDTLIIYLVTCKLDANTLKEWEEFSADKEFCILDDLKKFLTQRANMLETLETRERRYVKPKETKAFFTSNTNIICPICSGKHFIQRCEKLLKLKINERINEVKGAKLCINCLRGGHHPNKCKGGKCRLCNESHNTLLHTDKVVETVDHTKDESNADASKTLASCLSTKESQILLSTVCIEIQGKNNKLYNARAVLDSGSQSSFITEELCKKCDIPISNLKFAVSCLNNVETAIRGKCVIEIKSKHEPFETKLDCLVMREITGYLPNVSFDKQMLNLPENINLADPAFNECTKVDLLIGADRFWDIICPEQRSLGKNKPILQQTKLGWIIAGPLGNQASNKVRCNLVSNLDLHNDLAKFWELEECKIDSSRKWSEEEKKCEDNFTRTTRRESDGRFMVTLPLKKSTEHLGQSLEQARSRFLNLERKLQSNKALKKEYTDFMHEYEELEHMSKIKDNHIGYYLPHHCVLKEDSTTTKLRVLFDASARTSTGTSLNDIMMVGPNIQEDLVSILLRFREHRYVISGDITKMYRQVLVVPEQRHLQKIVWREHPSDELSVYQLNTITYGTSAASFLAIRSLYQLAQDIKGENPKISRIIERDFYVDDLLSGSDTIEEAATICREVKDTLEKGCFVLRKFCSNEPSVLKYVAENNDKTTIINLGVNENTKTLGLTWCPNNDQLSYKIGQRKSEIATKRNILAATAQIFDPLGLVSPCIITPKLIMQQLWLDGLKWDDEVTGDSKNEWNEFQNELSLLDKLRIPRHVMSKDCKTIELHGFADASKRAYGGCIYARTIDTNGTIHVQLLCAKAKVAPTQTVSTPRLELCGALVLTRLMEKVRQSLSKSADTCVYWTDCTTVLGWLKMPPRCLKTFVANRVVEIQELTTNADWKHVSTTENPADILSRGTSVSRLQESELWWHGPKWLKRNQNEWPQAKPSIPKLPELLKEKSTCILSTNNDTFPFERFSSLSRLKRSVAYIFRFKNNCCATPEARHFGPLELIEINHALTILIKLAQQEVYGEEIRKLEKGKYISKRSNILCLKPFLDNKGVLRVGGRLANSNFDFTKKHPIILPKEHHLTRLLFRHLHKELKHAAPTLLLATMREEYWPISGRSIAKQTVRNCVRCSRCKPKFMQPCMGNLPKARLMPNLPFTISGVDYMGPFMIKDRKGRGCKTTKCYISLFVCFATKAIHVELVTSLTKDAFLMALKRFAARRGRPQVIHSDNGTNFVAANNELKQVAQFLQENEGNIKEECVQQKIKWEFIPPHSPHFGGLWEAGVKAVKYHLKRVMGDTIFTYEELYTIAVQIEAILNSRPLSPLSSDPDDLNPLTPGHFLVGRPLMSVPDLNYTNIQSNRLSNYQHIQAIQQQFWKRWSREYIAEMQQRNKWKNSTGDAKPGDLVIIKDDNLPPMRWKLGRIVSFHPGKDGVNRVVILKTQGGLVKRAVRSICVLPTEA